MQILWFFPTHGDGRYLGTTYGPLIWTIYNKLPKPLITWATPGR